MSRETSPELLQEAFRAPAAALADHVDPVLGLRRLAEFAVRLLPVDTAAAVLRDVPGTVSAAWPAGAAEAVWTASGDDCPLHACARSGEPVADTALHDLAAGGRRPRFAATALAHGYTRVAAVPLLSRGRVLGGLGLLRHGSEPLGPAPLLLARTLADAAALGAAQRHAAQDGAAPAALLERALRSRIAVERAAGVMAARLAVSPGQATAILALRAGGDHDTAAELATAVLDGRMDAHALLDPPEH